MVMHASNSSIWEAEDKKSRVQGQPQPHIQIKVSLGCTHPLAARDIARGGVLAQHVPVRASWLTLTALITCAEVISLLWLFFLSKQTVTRID